MIFFFYFNQRYGIIIACANVLEMLIGNVSQVNDVALGPLGPLPIVYILGIKQGRIMYTFFSKDLKFLLDINPKMVLVIFKSFLKIPRKGLGGQHLIPSPTRPATAAEHH